MVEPDVYAQLDALYAELPKLECRGKCQDSCGPIDMGLAERQRIAEQGVKIPPLSSPCPALTFLGTCGVYEVRPLICFLPDALVHTPRGPRRMGEILAGDTVYGGDGRKHRVVATASRWYDGPIINVRHSPSGMDCWSTADHRWLVATQKDKRRKPAPGWKPAGKLVPKRHHQAGDYLTFPAAYEDVPDLTELAVADYVGGLLSEDGYRLMPYSGTTFAHREARSVPARLLVDDEFLYMLGIYLAEGSASIQSAQFTLAADERHIAERIGKYLAAQDIPYTIQAAKRNTLTLRSDSAVYARLMKALAGTLAPSKAVNGELWGQMSHRQRWLVYLAWDEGDGRKCLREQEMSTTTISRVLAAQMAFAALANGMFPRVYGTQRPNRGHVNYDVHLFPSNWRGPKANHGTKLMADDLYVYTPVGDLDRRSYSGPVVDIQVEGAGSFITTSGIVHNCRLWGLVEAMACPWGCMPEGGFLDDTNALGMVSRSQQIGGRSRTLPNLRPEDVRRLMADPDIATAASSVMHGRHREVHRGT